MLIRCRDEAAANLSSLKFSQSNRAPDPKDASRVITTTTTTTFSMSRDMAKEICQHFMDAHLIENASDLSSSTFKERGPYMNTPKGLHILERFITKNGISAQHTHRLFAQQPICMKLLHLERRSTDDDIIITKGVVEVLWRRFVGREPNVTRLSENDLQAQNNVRWYNKPSSSPLDEVDRSIGVVLRKVSVAAIDKGSPPVDEYHFSAWSAVDWVCDFSTCVGPDEGAELAAQFVRYGLITLVSDKGRARENDIIATARVGGAGGGSGAVSVSAGTESAETIRKKRSTVPRRGLLIGSHRRECTLRTGNLADPALPPLARRNLACTTRTLPLRSRPKAHPALPIWETTCPPEVLGRSTLGPVRGPACPNVPGPTLTRSTKTWFTPKTVTPLD